ncbi:MAG: cell division protein FtsZ [Patescibacteria group bacterium]|nr:cell division protein FtsZ [Patescibacteria group bacterium]
MAEVKPAIETFAKIKVIGIGGSGCSATNRMITSKIKGVEFIAANTDVQALHYSQAPVKIHLGKTITRGLGAGMNPDVGKQAAMESQNELRDALKGADMVFVTCGLGGGTGSGGAPIVAEIARDLGALTVAVVTKPFAFEGAQRRDIAEKSHAELAQHVDSIITIPNDRVLQIVDKKTSLLDAFDTVDDVLRQGVQGISELITVHGLINVDFADVRAIMAETGTALMGIGRATGDNRAVEAAKAAVSSPLLEVSIEGARGILVSITGNSKMGMHEVSEATKVITANAHENARVIWGMAVDETMKDELKVCVIATGFDGDHKPLIAAKGVGEPVYSANRFLKKDIQADATKSADANATRVGATEEAAEEPTRPFVKRTLGVTREPSAYEPQAATAAAEEDIEIPAFIRRKMG